MQYRFENTYIHTQNQIQIQIRLLQREREPVVWKSNPATVRPQHNVITKPVKHIGKACFKSRCGIKHVRLLGNLFISSAHRHTLRNPSACVYVCMSVCICRAMWYLVAIYTNPAQPEAPGHGLNQSNQSKLLFPSNHQVDGHSVAAVPCSAVPRPARMHAHTSTPSIPSPTIKPLHTQKGKPHQV